MVDAPSIARNKHIIKMIGCDKVRQN